MKDKPFLPPGHPVVPLPLITLRLKHGLHMKLEPTPQARKTDALPTRSAFAEIPDEGVRNVHTDIIIEDPYHERSAT